MEETPSCSEDASTLPASSSTGIHSGVSFNAYDSAIQLNQTENIKPSNSNNIQSLLTSPLTSLRLLSRRSQETSRSTSESLSNEDSNELEEKKQEDKFGRAAVERKNLLNMVRLSIKSVIESSLSAGHTLDSDHQPLQQFFIIIENVLEHRLKVSRRFFSQNKHYWPPLEAIEKFHSSAGPITTSVRSLPGIKTFVGRCRAWLRLALMQKKLAEYFQVIIENRSYFREWYEDDAFLMSDDASVMLGHLVGLNCIDANLCMKELDLDNQMTTIDFSMYVKDSIDIPIKENVDEGTVTQKLLDQKNYLEERNRFLETNAAELLKKVAVLESASESQKGQLESLRSRMNTLESVNEQLNKEKEEIVDRHERMLRDRDQDAETVREEWNRSKTDLDGALMEMKEQLKQETAVRLDVERELQHQMSLKQELELALKLQDKDLSHKQQGLVALRQQLDDVKAANADLYLKLQTTSEHEDRSAMTESLTSQVSKLEADLEESNRQAEVAREQAGRYSNQLDDAEKTKNVLSTNLHIEREWRQSLQKEEEKREQEIVLLREKIEMMLSLKEELERVTQERDHFHKLSQVSPVDAGSRISSSLEGPEGGHCSPGDG